MVRARDSAASSGRRAGTCDVLREFQRRRDVPKARGRGRWLHASYRGVCAWPHSAWSMPLLSHTRTHTHAILQAIAPSATQLLDTPVTSGTPPYNHNQVCVSLLLLSKLNRQHQLTQLTAYRPLSNPPPQPHVGGSKVSVLSLHGTKDTVIPYGSAPTAIVSCDRFMLFRCTEIELDAHACVAHSRRWGAAFRLQDRFAQVMFGKR